MPQEKIAKVLRPYVDLGFSKTEEISDQWRGDCILCGKENKLYIGTDDVKPPKIPGGFSCYAGICGHTGNIYTMLRLLVEKTFRNGGRN